MENLTPWQWLFRIAVALGGVGMIALAWRSGRSRAFFVVRVVDGVPRAVKGTVTPAFLRLVREVAGWNGVKRGRVSGVERPSGIALEFSREFPEWARQQLRNGWGTMGWSAGPRRRRR